MTRKEKINIIESLVEKFSSSDCFYIIDATGLTVEKINTFRRECFASKVIYQVVKNTLISKALEKLNSDIDYVAFSKDVLKGFSGILFVQDNSSVPAKLIKEFRKQQQLSLPILKGASINGDLFIGEAQLDTLSKLKSREELIGEIMILLRSPISNVISSLQRGKDNLLGIIKAFSSSS